MKKCAVSRNTDINFMLLIHITKGITPIQHSTNSLKDYKLILMKITIFLKIIRSQNK